MIMPSCHSFKKAIHASTTPGKNDDAADRADRPGRGAQSPVLADKRPEAAAQGRTARIVHDSPRVQRQKALTDAIQAGAPALARRTAQPNRTGLPDDLKAGIESLSGMQMDHVKVHYNSDKPAQLQAHAYAQGHEIHLAAGQERHLPHEAWHVVQQAQGRVRPTIQMKGTAVNDDPSLEGEADTMGEKAARFKGAPLASGTVPARALAGAPIQAHALQRRTDAAQQRGIAETASRIVALTEPALLSSLNQRISFHPSEAGYLARAAAFPALRAHAQLVQNDFGNVFSFVIANHYTNYGGAELDVEVGRLATDLAEIAAVRTANNGAAVEASKTAMLNAVAKNNLWERAKGHGGNAFRHALTRPLAQAALTNWEQRYFNLDRSQLINAAKRRASNGGSAAATVWHITPDIGGYTTHMTVYNGDIVAVGPVYVTNATVRANSDAAANQILANGAGTMGIHLTLEVNPSGANPRVFGNPPAIARNSGVALPNGIGWADFVAPLAAAQGEVRNDVWIAVDSKLQDRP